MRLYIQKCYPWEHKIFIRIIIFYTHDEIFKCNNFEKK